MSYKAVKVKPAGCSKCPFRLVGTGFVPPEGDEKSKIALVLDSPRTRDVFAGKPLYDWFGTYFFGKIAGPLGLERGDFYIDHTIRCRTPGDAWPVGAKGEGAREGCRTWDREGFLGWRPTKYVISYSPRDLREQPAVHRLVESSVQRAMRLVEEGERPAILCGAEVTKVFLPHLPLTQEWKKKSYIATWQGSVHDAN